MYSFFLFSGYSKSTVGENGGFSRRLWILGELKSKGLTHSSGVFYLNIKEFKDMTDEWLDFIIDCRSGKPHQYDIVIGAMANDQIYNYVSDYIDGAITREQFWVLAKFKYPTHQINFCTREALKCLEYRGYEETR